jgi:MFS family permease
MSSTESVPSATPLASDGVIPPDRRWITAALLLVMVLASMEATVTSTAMPTIIGDLHGLEHYSWVASIYLLASTITMPLYGRLSDVLGRKRVLLFSIGLFAAGSLLASLSHSMLQLIVFRGIQGLGAGGIMPVVLTILGDIFTLQERANIQGVFSAVWGTASLAGPLLGAFLVGTTRFSPYVPAFVRPMLGWPTIFWVNLPAGFAGVVVLMLKYHDHQKPHSEDLDLPGVTLLAIGSTSLLTAVSLAAGVSVSIFVPAVALVVGVGAMMLFVRRERVALNPIMPPSLMLHRAIGPSMLVSGLLGIGVFAIDTYVPLYVQGGQGRSAGAAAATVTPVMLAWASSGVVAAPLIMRWGFKRMATIGATLIAVGFTGLLICSVVNAPLWVITALLFITGFGFGPNSMSILLAAQDAVQWQQRGIVTSGITFARNFGGALGVGLFGALFNILTATRLHDLSAGNFSTGDLLDPHKLGDLQKTHPTQLAAAQYTITHGLVWVFVAMLAAAVVQIFVSRMIPAHKGSHKITPAEMLEAVG